MGNTNIPFFKVKKESAFLILLLSLGTGALNAFGFFNANLSVLTGRITTFVPGIILSLVLLFEIEAIGRERSLKKNDPRMILAGLAVLNLIFNIMLASGFAFSGTLASIAGFTSIITILGAFWGVVT